MPQWPRFWARSCAGLASACDWLVISIDALEGAFLWADMEDLALDTSHLGGVGKRHIPIERIAHPDASGLDAPMGLIRRRVLRGEGLPGEACDVSLQGWLVVFDREDIVRLLVADQIAGQQFSMWQ